MLPAARYHYDLPFPDSRETHSLSVGPNQDAWAYDNDLDIIGQLTIMIESKHPLEAPQPTEDILVQSGAETKTKGKIAINHGSGQKNYTLVGTWRNICSSGLRH